MPLVRKKSVRMEDNGRRHIQVLIGGGVGCPTSGDPPGYRCVRRRCARILIHRIRNARDRMAHGISPYIRRLLTIKPADLNGAEAGSTACAPLLWWEKQKKKKTPKKKHKHKKPQNKKKKKKKYKKNKKKNKKNTKKKTKKNKQHQTNH